MKIPANVQADWKLAAVAIGGVIVLYYLAKREATAAVTAVGGAINPVSKENVFYKATSAVVNATAGQSADGPKNLGEWFYSKINPEGWKIYKG